MPESYPRGNQIQGPIDVTVDIADGAITAAKLASNAVTTAKITDANVTTAKIADVNVTTAKIADLNVTEGKIAAGAVTEAKIGALAVSTAKIQAQAVTNAEIANTTIQGGKLSIFQSAEVTGTGAGQTTAHGLAYTPTVFWATVTEDPAGTGFDVSAITADATNLTVTVTNGVKYRLYAM